ncbi:hypothetical protein J6590_013014 [Homalodisca vitripennis]|nr:hypothetical protein J6590_013014 [Homalodisca vitripennis]
MYKARLDCRGYLTPVTGYGWERLAISVYLACEIYSGCVYTYDPVVRLNMWTSSTVIPTGEVYLFRKDISRASFQETILTMDSFAGINARRKLQFGIVLGGDLESIDCFFVNPDTLDTNLQSPNLFRSYSRSTCLRTFTKQVDVGIRLIRVEE